MKDASTDVFVTAVEGNRQWLDGGAMFGNVPRALWEKWCVPDSRGRIELACRALLIECEGKRILCETGIGAFFAPELADRFGVLETEHRLLQSLAARGLSDADIDAVILSHLHFDHAGGLLPAFADITAGNDRLLFPKARYVVGKEALARAEHPHPRDRASFIPGMVDKLKASGRLEVVQGESLAWLFPDRLSFRYSNGHTPGQMHTLFRGQSQNVFFAGDLVPGTAWIHLAITMGYDRYAEQVIDEKAALYGQAFPEHWLLFFTHDAEVAAAELGRDDKGRYQAAKTLTKLERYAI